MQGVLLATLALALVLFSNYTCDCMFAAALLLAPLLEPRPVVPLLAPVFVLLQLIPQPALAPKFVLLGTSAGSCP